MKLLFRQRLFSWLDSYDIFDEDKNVVYMVKGRLGFGHRLQILAPDGRELGMVQEKVFAFLPRFEIYRGEQYLGYVKKELTFLHPKFTVDFNGWHMEGDVFGFDYSIVTSSGELVATISKKLIVMTDTYVLDVQREEATFCALALILAVDAEKCSRK